jgi:hypothetical protein
MIRTEEKYRAERGTTPGTYQAFTATREAEGDRNFIRVELDHLTRWRSPAEYADYLRWAADEIMKLPKGAI